MKSLDLFSCIGCHAIGFRRAGIETVMFCEFKPERRTVLARHFPEIPIHDDVRSVVKMAGEVQTQIYGVCGNSGPVPARPLAYSSIFHRIRAAWLVWTGRADALTWPGQ